MRRLYELLHSPAALLAFEAAARHLSFTRAAAELNVTQPAISSAVRKLETALGAALFDRRNRRIVLTEAGERFFADVTHGLGHILKSAEAVAVQSRPDHVTIACSMAFAQYWMVPRLSDVRSAVPDVEIRMETSTRDTDLVREGVSLGIRRGNGRWPGYHSAFLIGEAISPVCAPGLIENAQASDLIHQPLIHLEEPSRLRPTWVDYFAAQSVAFRDDGAGLRLNEYALVLQAALAGQGIALGWHHLTDPLVAQGLLIRPTQETYSQVNGFYLVWSDQSDLHPQAALVRDWLVAEGAKQKVN